MTIIPTNQLERCILPGLLQATHPRPQRGWWEFLLGGNVWQGFDGNGSGAGGINTGVVDIEGEGSVDMNLAGVDCICTVVQVLSMPKPRPRHQNTQKVKKNPGYALIK